MNQLNYQEVLRRDYLEKIYGWAVNRVGDYDQAADLAQEILTELHLALARNPKIDSFPAWVWSIARYTYYRWMRKWTHHQSLDEVWGISCEREIDAALLEAEEL